MSDDEFDESPDLEAEIDDDDIDEEFDEDDDQDEEVLDDLDDTVEVEVEEGDESVAEEDAEVVEEEDEDVVDLEEELHPDDVEDALDVVLRERTAKAGLEEEDEEEEVDERGEGGTKIVPRRPGEFLCSSCFLVLPRHQLADEKGMRCRDCA